MSARLKPKGFTLIELLVVISILAILSVIGMAVFSGVSKNARNARRKADVDAMAKVLEVNKAANGYQGALQNGWFASGAIPKDPIYNTDCNNASANSSANGGCAKYIPPPDPNHGTWGYVVCGAGTLPTNQLGSGGCLDFSSSTVPDFYVCTRLEGGSGGNFSDMWFTDPAANGGTYCKRNQQ